MKNPLRDAKELFGCKVQNYDSLGIKLEKPLDNLKKYGVIDTIKIFRSYYEPIFGDINKIYENCQKGISKNWL